MAAGTSSGKLPPPLDELAHQLQSDPAHLAARYHDALRRTIFANRSDIRPAVLGQLAEAEVQALLAFLHSPTSQAAAERGAVLCQLGLSEQAVLQLGEVTRHFLLTHLEDTRTAAGLETIDAYHTAVIRGFIQAREKVILSEQERIRSALQRTLGRYTVQMEVAAGVASATTSILTLDPLLETTVGLIRERFELQYVGAYLLDDDQLWAVLRAGSGVPGQPLLAVGFRLEVGGPSLIGRCVAEDEPQVLLDADKGTARRENHLRPDTTSAAAIPLRTRGKVIGALTVESRRVAAFADLDMTVLRILADQLANAIENARLFAELRRSEEKYRTILESIEEGYYETDLDGAFVFVNDAVCTILGSSRAEVLGANYRSFIDPEYLDGATRALDLVQRTAEMARGVEYKIVHQDDLARFVEMSASLVRDPAGQPLGLRGILRDVTKRKQMEQYLIERRALERSNRELEQFAYVASHDLQEPLRKIQAFGDRLKTKHGAAMNDEGRDYLDRMLNASLRMHTLINDLLTLSRVATKAQPFVPVDLARVTREVISDLEARIEQTGGRVQVGDLPMLEADPVQMRQLLQNLIGNGLKFHRPGVPPVIKVHGKQFRERRMTRGLGRDVICQIVVEDNGIGFDEKYVERIFQPFQRLHGRNESEGTGIGLTICQRIAERHGGRITATSAPNQGATFIVTLPAQQIQGETSA